MFSLIFYICLSFQNEYVEKQEIYDRIDYIIGLSVPDDYLDNFDQERKNIKYIMYYYAYKECDLDIDSLFSLAIEESRMNPYARHHNNDGSSDGGWFQQNSYYWRDRFKETKEYVCDHKHLKKFCKNMKNDKNDIITNLLVSIYNIDDNVQRYNLTGDSIYVSHHCTACLNPMNHIAKRYLKKFKKIRKEIKDGTLEIYG